MPLTVNGEAIDDEVIRNEEAQLRPRLREAMPQESAAARDSRAREWARDNAIERVLLRQAAISDGEPISAEILSDSERLEAEVQGRLERLTARLTAKLVPPRAKEISEYYRKNRDQFFSSEMVHAAHILKKVDEQTTGEVALEKMRGIRMELEQGRDFAEAADKCSDDKGPGGDLGYFARGQMVAAFEAVAFSLEPGQVSEPFRTPFGYHIVKVYDRRQEGLRSFEEVKANIEVLLFNLKKQRRIEQYVDTLRAKADIQQ
jgi:parvulin-like peptidyl-prolyl isomerase